MTATMTRAEQDRLTRLLIADQLGIATDAITADILFEYGVGSLDEGAASVLWLRNYTPVKARGETHVALLG